MRRSADATDEDLLEVLRPALGEIRSLERQPYAFSTSHRLEQLDVETPRGRKRLIFKNLGPEGLLPVAQGRRPELLHDPRREIDVHRLLLRPLGLRPRCVATHVEPGAGRYWLICEKADGVELWQVGEPDVWTAVAGWLGRFHARHRGRTASLRTRIPHLIEHDAEWFHLWCRRATAALCNVDGTLVRELLALLRDAEQLVRPLVAAPRTILHGEFYASNVLVNLDAETVAVLPVDWEMAGIGPGALDLAALACGWDLEMQNSILEAYAAGAERSAALEVVAHELAAARFHMALRWLGWSSAWTPPVEHARDWIGEALDAAATLYR